MRRNNSTRSSSSYPASNVNPAKNDGSIITEYERGTRWAGWLLIAMFAVLTAGVVLFGW